jgi:hypothetical protein
MGKIQINTIENIQPIDAKQFIRLVTAASQGISVESVKKQEQEQSRKYMRDGVTILSQALAIDKKTVYGWGDNINYAGMPGHHKLALGYAKAANVHNNFAVSIMEELYEAPEISGGEFLEELFGLSSLSKRQCLKAASRPDFRFQCKKILAHVLQINERTVDAWGSDMYFEAMPEKYGIILGYALMAVKSPIIAEFNGVA